MARADGGWNEQERRGNLDLGGISQNGRVIFRWPESARTAASPGRAARPPGHPRPHSSVQHRDTLPPTRTARTGALDGAALAVESTHGASTSTPVAPPWLLRCASSFFCGYGAPIGWTGGGGCRRWQGRRQKATIVDLDPGEVVARRWEVEKRG
jgi:hypothetical protein